MTKQVLLPVSENQVTPKSVPSSALSAQEVSFGPILRPVVSPLNPKTTGPPILLDWIVLVISKKDGEGRFDLGLTNIAIVPYQNMLPDWVPTLHDPIG